MAIETFRPAIGPSPGTGHKPQLKIREAEFGDGYSQPTPDGVNHVRKTTSLKWDALTTEQMWELEEFFMSHGGTKPFYYKPFGERSMLIWTCKEWSNDTQEGLWSFSASLVQSFTNER